MVTPMMIHNGTASYEHRRGGVETITAHHVPPAIVQIREQVPGQDIHK
jgi:hypothetical protein